MTGRDLKEPIAAPTPAPVHAPNPPLLPVKREWREAVLEGLREFPLGLVDLDERHLPEIVVSSDHGRDVLQ